MHVKVLQDCLLRLISGSQAGRRRRQETEGQAREMGGAKRNRRQSFTDTWGDRVVAVFLQSHYTFQKSCLDFPVNCKTAKQMDVKSHRRGEQCVLPNWARFSLWCLFPGGNGDITPGTETFYTRMAERNTLELPVKLFWDVSFGHLKCCN